MTVKERIRELEIQPDDSPKLKQLIEDAKTSLKSYSKKEQKELRKAIKISQIYSDLQNPSKRTLLEKKALKWWINLNQMSKNHSIYHSDKTINSITLHDITILYSIGYTYHSNRFLSNPPTNYIYLINSQISKEFYMYLEKYNGTINKQLAELEQFLINKNIRLIKDEFDILYNHLSPRDIYYNLKWLKLDENLRLELISKELNTTKKLVKLTDVDEKLITKIYLNKDNYPKYIRNYTSYV